MKKIEPQPAANEVQAEHSLKWLAEKDNHALDGSGLSNIVRLLITKINEQQDEIDSLRELILPLG